MLIRTLPFTLLRICQRLSSISVALVQCLIHPAGLIDSQKDSPEEIQDGAAVCRATHSRQLARNRQEIELATSQPARF